MPSNHSLIVAAICALPLSIAACGGSSDSTITPEGTHYQYVISSALVPTTDAQTRQFGLDLGSKTSTKLDGIIDNQLGSALVTLATLGFDVQGTINTSVDQGSIILLVDFQTKDFTTSNGAGLEVKLGANPVPPACNGAADTTCRHHLTGTGMFQIAANSPSDAVVAGKIASGTFNGGPGDLTLQIAIGSAASPIKLDLLHARVQATSITDAGMTAILGGLVTQDALMTQIGPSIQGSVSAVLDRDCTPRGAPPDCGCKVGSTGALVIGALDGDLVPAGGPAKDCMVSVDEILGFPLVAQVLKPDSCSTESCKAPDSLSIGIKVQAVKASFPM